MRDEHGKPMNYFAFYKEIIDLYYFEGKINLTDMNVITFLNYHVNPVNGFASVSYEQLEKELKGKIKKTYLRKILSKLRKVGLIWFEDNSGSKGPIKLWCYEYLLKGRRIISLEDIKKSKNKSKVREQLSSPIHKSELQKVHIDKKQKQPSQEAPFTSPYTNTDTNKDTNTYTDNQLINKVDKFNSSSGIIPIGEVIDYKKRIRDGWKKSGSKVKPPGE